MSFARPEMLWLLTMLPALAFWAALARLRRARGWAALGQGSRLRGEGAVGWIIAIACLIVALAQPTWGKAPLPPLPAGHDVVLLVDTSRSMGAEDAVPNRLRVAVEAAESLIDALRQEPGNRAAVVAFAGRGELRCPLTEHLGAVRETLERLHPGDVRPGGTDLAAALDEALDAFDDQEHAEGRAIVLFSDGDDLAGVWPHALEALREAKVVVHSVAIGDAERGHTVPSGKARELLKFEGAPVLSKRTDQPLEELSKASGGAMVRLGLAPADLGALYVNRIEPVAKRKREALKIPERVERFPVFVLAALASGLAGGWPGWRRWWFGRAWLVLPMMLVLGAGPPTGSAADRVAAGRAAFDAGKLEEALAAFEAAVALDPRSAVPRYDMAAALFQIERYEEALAAYGEARARAGPALRTKIDYALGNTALALGDVAAAIRHYDDCLASTASGAVLDAVRRDAAINRQFAEEQAKQPSAPPKNDEPPPTPPDRPRDQNPSGDDGGEGGSGSNPSGAPPGGVPPPGGGSAGGPKGGGDSRPRPGSAEDRLNNALEHVREAQRRRLADEVPPADETRKDW